MRHTFYARAERDSLESICQMSPTTTNAGDAALLEHGSRSVSPLGQETMTRRDSKGMGESGSSLKTIHESPFSDSEKSMLITDENRKDSGDPLSQLDELVEVAGIEEAYIYVHGMLSAAATPASSRRGSLSLSKMPPGYTTGMVSSQKQQLLVTENILS